MDPTCLNVSKELEHSKLNLLFVGFAVVVPLHTDIFDYNK